MKTLSDNIKAILSIVVILFSFGYFSMCSIRDLKPDPQILIAIVGSVGTVLGYHFGSSSGKGDAKVTVTGDSPTIPVSTGYQPTYDNGNIPPNGGSGVPPIK